MDHAVPTYTHRVRYHECDAQGIMFNSRYLELVDVAMTELLRRLGWSYPEFVAAGADVSVVRAEVDYRSPARFDDVLDLDVTCRHVGTSSFRLATDIRRGGDQIARTELVYVNLDPAGEGSRPLPDVVVAALRGVMA